MNTRLNGVGAPYSHSCIYQEYSRAEGPIHPPKGGLVVIHMKHLLLIVQSICDYHDMMGRPKAGHTHFVGFGQLSAVDTTFGCLCLHGSTGDGRVLLYLPRFLKRHMEIVYGMNSVGGRRRRPYNGVGCHRPLAGGKRQQQY